MNCPSRTDEQPMHDGHNQNPSALAADLTTRQDLNGIVNLRTDQDSGIKSEDDRTEIHISSTDSYDRHRDTDKVSSSLYRRRLHDSQDATSQKSYQAYSIAETRRPDNINVSDNESPRPLPGRKAHLRDHLLKWSRASGRVLKKFLTFIGPGFLIAVAYIDPGNYSTDVAAGAATQYRLLFIVLMSNVIAVFLQSLAIRLGTVTGLNLAEHCKAHLPWWLNLPLYALGEAAIIATDIAEVIGSAIAINLLIPKIPLTWACVITVLDVLILLMFWSPNGANLRRERFFHYFIVALVMGVVICFCIELSFIHQHQHVSAAEVLKGYLPSAAVVGGQGIYLSCGILGATVMPHSLYLGSGMVQSRLRSFDVKAGNLVPETFDGRDKQHYKPSLAAIDSCLWYSTAEVIFSLCIFALLVNSAILIVAGASLSHNSTAEGGDLFGIYDLLSKTLASAAGTVFALALLLSGTSAGIVCTMAGQMLSEGALNWKAAPWIRRLVTRSVSIIPAIIIAGAIGRQGLSAALNATQVCLSVALPFVSAPLIYFTARNKYMVVSSTRTILREDVDDHDFDLEQDSGPVTKMRNHWLVSTLAIAMWFILAIMNVALLVLLGMGKA